MSRASVLVYRNVILALSETFIATPAAMMTRYEAWFTGTKFRPHDLVDASHVIRPVEGGDLRGLRTALFKAGGVVPAEWLERLKGHSPRLLHAQFGTDGVFAAPLAKALGIPMIVTFFGFDATIGPSAGVIWRIYQQKRRKLYLSVDRILTVSEFIRSRLIDDGCPAAKVETHYTGVDTETFRPPEARDREPIVLFVGRLVEKKGCADLIEAMERLGDERREFRLLIIGEGPLRGELQRRASRLPTVQFLGARPPNEVRDWMARASIFALPSRTARSADAEGLPFVILEAQSMGLPVLSTRHAGIAEAVVHGETGLLCAEGDLDTLTQHLGLLIADSSLRTRMGEAGRRRMVAAFDLRTQTARLEQIYDRVIEGWRAAAH